VNFGKNQTAARRGIPYLHGDGLRTAEGEVRKHKIERYFPRCRVLRLERRGKREEHEESKQIQDDVAHENSFCPHARAEPGSGANFMSYAGKCGF
jgi:hypothetical protein